VLASRRSQGKPVPSICLRGPEDKSAPATAPGSMLGERYEILGEIARGGMGAVLKGRDLDLGRELAFKVLLEQFQNDLEVVRRFLEEAQIGGQLQHPGIVPVHELGQFPDGRPYFTMKLVEGRTLANLLKERADPAQDLPRFLKVFEQVCQTMAYAHSRGVIHRDLKPSNIMVGAFGEVQVMDWGLAKVLDQPGSGRQSVGGAAAVRTVRSDDTDGRTQAGAVMGTPAYMPPEQARGEIDQLDERCDVFALGAMLCEILTGQPPYRGKNFTETYKLAVAGELTGVYACLGSCGADAPLVVLACSCLSAERDQRPRNAGEVAEAVTRYLASVQERLKNAEVERATAQAKAAEEQKRRRLRTALVGSGVGLLLLAVGAWVWIAQEQARVKQEQAARQEADRLRGQAEKAQQEAEGARQEIAWLNYARQVALAHREWQDANVAHSQQLLQACPAELRGWEWHYVNRLHQPTYKVFFQKADSPVFSVCFSPDGQRLAASMRGNPGVRVWDSTTGKELWSWSPRQTPGLSKRNIQSLVFSPDGKRLAGGLEVGGEVQVWDAATGKELLNFKGTGPVSTVCFSPDGKRLAIACKGAGLAEELPTAAVHDSTTGKKIADFTSSTLGNAICFTADGNLVAIDFGPKEFCLWQTGAGKIYAPYVGHAGKVLSICCSSRGDHLASASVDKTIIVWETHGQGKELIRLHGHRDKVCCVRFSPDGKRLG
jgi:hypothetical protein